MSMPIDPNTAKGLLDSGNMNPDTYYKYFGSGIGLEAAPAAPPSLKQDPSSFMRDDKGEAKQAAINVQKNQIEQRKNQLKAFGVSDEDIEARVRPELERLAEQERGLLLTEEKESGTPPDVQLTTDAQPQTQVDPRDQLANTAINAGFDLQQQGIGMAAAAGAAKAAENVAAISETQKKLADIAKANADFQAQQQTKIMEAETDLKNEIERVSNLKVDPSRYWAEKSTGQKIGLGISLFLGALGAGQTGVNQAANVINSAIDQDIKIQQGDIAQQTKGLDRKRGLFAEMKRKYKDDLMAREATRAAYLQDAQLKIQEIANKYEGQDISAKAMQLIGQIETQKQAAQSAFLSRLQQTQPVTADANVNMLTEDQRERFVPGYGLALTKEAAKQGRELAGTIESIKGNIDELIKISQQSGKSLSPTDRARANTISSILIGQLRLPIVGPGAVSEKELELLQTIIADPTRIMSLDVTNRQRLKTLRERMDTQTANQLKTLGLIAPENKLGFTPLK